MDAFWAAIDAQLANLSKATTVDDVPPVCPHVPDLSSGNGWFGGNGGDMWEALVMAGWRLVASEADYYWCMAAPSPGPELEGGVRPPGDDLLSYVEGDLYRDNQLVKGA